VSTITMPPDVARAVAELERVFSGRVRVEATDPSGAIVRLRDTELGSGWSSPTADLWFAIPFHYPDAAIYPYYVTGATPAPGVGGGALQPVAWRDMPATQVSLRHNAWDPTNDTAVGSVLQTQGWLRTS
jgi:hypothetical protein